MPRLRLLPGDIELPIRDGETILAAICRDGFTYGYGCRRGGCGVCKVDLQDGEISYTRPIADTVLTDEERDAGVVLSCRAEAASEEVVLRMRESSRFRLAVPLAFGIARRELAHDKERGTARRARGSAAGPGTDE